MTVRELINELGFYPDDIKVEFAYNYGDYWNTTNALSFINMPILQRSDEIRNAVLVVHG